MQNVPIEKVHLIRNAYNPKPILNITEDWQEIIKSHQSKTVVTMIANFFDEKDHETVLKAWKLILEIALYSFLPDLEVPIIAKPTIKNDTAIQGIGTFR